MELEKVLRGYRSAELAKKVVEHINALAKEVEEANIVHVCGTHEYTIVKSGIRSLLPPNVEVRSGPGCPVCVCPPSDIDAAIELAFRPNVVVTTFGDMYRVPSTKYSLAEAAAKGASVRVVYGIGDAVELAKKIPDKEVVHFAIGFETTAPSTAYVLSADPPPNFSIVPSHRLIPPAIEHLLNLGEARIDGFILPGHVSTIIGAKPYRPISQKYRVPQVIAGFEPLDVLIGVAMLLQQMVEGRSEVEIEYTRSVREEGNVRAQQFMEKVFEPVEAGWRGIGKIPQSGYRLRSNYEQYDAISKFEVEVDESAPDTKPGCRCGEILRGLCYPQDCPLFGKACTPRSPYGPCMVSSEGACFIAYRYGKYIKL